MPHALADILSYPRYLIRSDIELGGCCYFGLFNVSSRECLECVDSADCRWLKDIDHMQETVPDRQLLHALEYAIRSVSAQSARLEHNPSVCTCDACTWLRDARALLDPAAINSSG